MVISEIVTLLIYAISMVFLPEFFGTLCHLSREILIDLSCRLDLCLVDTVCLEGRGNRGCQCTSIIYYQGY